MKQVKFTLSTHEARDNAVSYILEQECNGKREVIIRDTESDRTQAQNNLYQWWTQIIAADLGYSHKALKDLMIREFLPSKIITDFHGRDVEIWPDTTKLTKRNFSTYLNMIDMWAAEQGIVLPKPADKWAAAMGEKAA